MDKMEDIRKQVESMAEDTPKHLGLVVSLDDIDKKALSDRQKEEFNKIVSDLKKIGIKLEIDSGHLVLGYDKGKEGIINWGDYPITVPEEKVKNVKMEETKAIQRELDRRTELEQKAVKLMEQGNFEDANALLKSMDDSILKGIGDTPKHLGLVVSLDDIDKNTLSDWKKEEFTEIVSDLKKIGIKLEIDSGHLVLGYDKGKEGIINWDDYPIRVLEEKVKNVDIKGAGNVEQEMNKAEILNQDKEFKYQLLDRMRSDCEYYLGYGNEDAKCLWAGNEKEQIETMRAIYNSFSQNEKPEWITLEQIDGFEKEMVDEIQIEPDLGIIYIEELKSEIVELETLINGFKLNKPEEISLVQEKIKDKNMQLRNEITRVLENADSEKLNNKDYLESINVQKINDIYIYKECTQGWTAVVTMDDILKMEEKNGSRSLEFKGCDIQSVIFNKKFEDCKFENCNLLSCGFENTEFVNTTFKSVTFYNNVLQNVKFDNCKFENCDNFEMIPYTNSRTEKSNNIEFINTEIKDSQINLNRADTNLDLKSVHFKNCSIQNLECCINKTNYQSQSITKKVNSEQTLMKLLGRDLRKSLKLGETTIPKKKQRRIKIH